MLNHPFGLVNRNHSPTWTGTFTQVEEVEEIWRVPLDTGGKSSRCDARPGTRGTSAIAFPLPYDAQQASTNSTGSTA